MAETAKKAEEATKAPEETKETAKEAPAKATGKTKKAEEAKVYNFTSTNKYLTCAGLGVQFVDGKASTTSLEVAKELVKLDGVELVEE